MLSKVQPPRFRVGDIVRACGAQFVHLRPTSPLQRRVLRALGRCRTEELGGYVETCNGCDHRRTVYNPCRNRHCPSCEGHAAEKWLQGLEQRILPCRYFHVVFTLPSQLRWLAFQNASLVYGLILTCAGQTLTEVARNPKYLGAQLGVTAVLHTWRDDLHLHPHAHCLVTAGGLSPDGDRWIKSYGERYLFPRALLAARFRGKLLSKLSRAHARGELRFAGSCKHLEDPEVFAALCDKLSQTRWLVYAKHAFRDLRHLLRYLARYTHRVGISDRRLLDVNDDQVTLATKTGDFIELHAFEFLERFLLHVLPKGFVKIRHYGLYATPSRQRLERARALLEAHGDPQDQEPSLEEKVEPEPTRCLWCLFGTLRREDLPPNPTFWLSLPEP